MDDPPLIDETDPDEVFALLADDTRVAILQALWETEGEGATFSELREAVGMRDSGQFNYHLAQLVGHFVEKIDDCYRLQPAGKNVVTAIYSGVVTENPPRERERIDEPCPYCEESIYVELRPEGIAKYCPECPGFYGKTSSMDHDESTEAFGFLGLLHLPPAGLQDRTPEQVYRAAQIWNNLTFMTLAHDICAWCSASLNHSVEVCEDHDASDGLCPACNQHLPIWLHSNCTNCIREIQTTVGARFFGRSEMLSFILDQGVNPISSTASERPPFDHEVVSTDPFEGRFIYEGDEESLIITVDENLDAVNVVRE